MSKKALEIINDIREWNKHWDRYDKGFRFKDEVLPLHANDFASYLTKKYSLKDE